MLTQTQAKNLIHNNPARLGYYVGFDDLTELHNDWLKKMLFKAGDQTRQSHRGSYKTTCDALVLALTLIIRPWENVLFLRKTDNDVNEVLELVKRIVESGCFQELSKAVTGTALKITKENRNEIDTNFNVGISGAPQILGLGLGTSVTGKHADLIITDDIVTIRDRVSAAEREKTKLMYQELQSVKNRGGRIINTGTPWHKNDAFGLMKNIEKHDCYSTGLMTDEQIRSLRESMSASLFAANYELKHIADEDAMFDDPAYTQDISRVFGGICHIDAAYGGADSTAFTILNEDKGQLVVYGKKYQKHVDDCVNEILTLKEKLRGGTTWNEFNADKGYLNKSLKARGDIAKSYHETMNKHIKISTYLKENWKRIVFLEDTDPEYIAEILDYTEHAQHDDCPDSLASAIRQLTDRKPATLNKVTGGL